jgi:hypothetical protein
MKKTALLCSLLLFAIYSYGQNSTPPDSTALINTSWKSYATNAALTYQQIVTTCDSLFAVAGYPDTGDKSRKYFL